MERHERLLIVITGPVGCGKSSTALALARTLQRPNLLVAVIDLDQVYGFVCQQNETNDEAAWNRARAGAAGLSCALFEEGVSVVIVEGEFFTREELDALLDRIPSSVGRQIFTLKASYAHAWARVQGDATRGTSRNPVFLQSMLDKFEQALPFLMQASTVVEADVYALNEVVQRLAGVVTL